MSAWKEIKNNKEFENLLLSIAEKKTKYPQALLSILKAWPTILENANLNCSLAPVKISNHFEGHKIMIISYNKAEGFHLQFNQEQLMIEINKTLKDMAINITKIEIKIASKSCQLNNPSI